jgi:hypothetical protein
VLALSERIAALRDGVAQSLGAGVGKSDGGSGRPSDGSPAVCLRILRSDNVRSSPLYAGAVSGIGSARAGRMASEAQKGVLARCARLRRSDEPTEPVARRRDRRANPLRALRKPYFSSEPRVLMHKRAASLGRTPFGAREDRHADSIAGSDRQEMGEDGGLIAVGRFVTMNR